MKYILALDQGTTSSRAIVFDKQGNIMGKAQQEFAQIYPHPGWVEHDPHDILGSQVGVIVPPSASPTSVKQPSCGTKTPASPSITP